MPALAYFITWTCYGSWLHGDERGSVDDTHNRYKTPYSEPDQQRATETRRSFAESPWMMSDQDRTEVEEAIRTAASIRSWRITELNVRTNHVHVVIISLGQEPEHVAQILKAWATRKLKGSGRHPGRTRFWTNQASTRHLFDDDAIASARRYVLNQ